jgi:polar amino acid transport system permease protein
MTEILTGLIPYILTGLQVTLEVTLIALGIGFIIGLALALLRVYGSIQPPELFSVSTMIIRALPHILLLLLMYFAISAVVNLTPFLGWFAFPGNHQQERLSM